MISARVDEVQSTEFEPAEDDDLDPSADLEDEAESEGETDSEEDELL